VFSYIFFDIYHPSVVSPCVFTDEAKAPSAQQQQQQFQPQQQQFQPQKPGKVQKTVEITIPQGVRPGNKITIKLPDGRQVQVTVPNGMRPGNKMTVNCAFFFLLSSLAASLLLLLCCCFL
jgi:hypothetical protein